MAKMIALALLVAAPLSAVPAVAAPANIGTISTLEAVASVNPNDGGTAIELAQAYLRADRPGEAMNHYRRALALDNVMLETRFGDAIWSHTVARQALKTVTALSAR
nr:tetratricopeptide repeat protein [Sphingomonas populi]